MPAWRDLLPEEDRRRMERAGFGAASEPGDRPALLVIDVTVGFVGTPGLSTDEAMVEYRNSCGPAAWEAMPHISATVTDARAAGIPVIWTRGRSARDAAHLGEWAAKNRRAVEDVARGDEIHRIVEEAGVAAGDLVFEKEKPSAFFGTSLVAHLFREHVDSVVITGCTTSGCVRATVVDAFSHNLGVTVVEDAVFDRTTISHAVGLFDMEAKYAQVAASEQVRQWWSRG
jgi:maleamate amidohydrolase